MRQQVLDNAILWIGDGTGFPGHVVVEGSRIVTVGEGRYGGGQLAHSDPSQSSRRTGTHAVEVVDVGGMCLSPGMIDLMVLGGFDRSILRDEPLEIAREYLRLGVTGCQFCIGTLPWDSMRTIAQKVQGAMGSEGGGAAGVLGLYLEGPFQQPDLTGASMQDYALPPTPEQVKRVLDELEAAVTMVNVAPGHEQASGAVRTLTRAGKVVSMAHSNAPAEKVLACVEAGTSVLGHVWDNNSGLIGDSGVQQPTLEHVALTDERIRFIHLICDGTHVHPIMMRLILRCRGVEAVCLVTDAVTRAGCPDGPYVWDDGRHFYKRGGVGRTDTGWLCGSALLVPDHLRTFVKFSGLPRHKAIRAVTLNPAASLGLEGRMGLLVPGRTADLVAWDERMRVRRVWRAGIEIGNVSDYGEVDLPAEENTLF